MKNIKRIILLLLIALSFFSCNKEEGSDVINPDSYPIVYYDLQTDDWEYLIRNEAEQLLVYKESDTGIVAFGINSPYDSLGYFFTSNDSVLSVTSNTFDFHIVMKEDSVLVLINDEESSHFYKYDYDSVFDLQDSKSCKLDNCNILSALFSEIVSRIIRLNPYTLVLYEFIDMVGTLRELDDIENTDQYIDWLENGNHNYDNIFRWARRKEHEHKSNPLIIAGISTGGNRVEGTTAYCLVDGYIKLQADIYYTGTLSANYGVCYSTSPNPTINDGKQEMSVSIGNGTISMTARLPYAFCISGLEESTTYYYRAFYEIDAINELVYGEIKQFTTEGLFEINTMASPSEGGNVTGGGRYPANTTITLTATANSGYEFTHWENGSDSNPRVITVEGDATYTAYFEKALPDLSGTWTCTETHYSSSGEPSYTSYEITLFEDGTVDCPTYPVISEGLSPGTYSVGSNGGVGISILQLHYYTNYWQDSGVKWEGHLDNMDHPTKITGHRYNWNYNYVGYFEGDHVEMIMTR